MRVFEIICMVIGAIIGAISGLAAGIELPKNIKTIRGAIKSNSDN